MTCSLHDTGHCRPPARPALQPLVTLLKYKIWACGFASYSLSCFGLMRQNKAFLLKKKKKKVNVATARPPTLSCGAVPGAYVGARLKGWSSVAPGPLPGHLAVQTGQEQCTLLVLSPR